MTKGTIVLINFEDFLEDVIRTEEKKYKKLLPKVPQPCFKL